MYKGIKLAFFSILLIMMSAAAVFADSTNIGWKGYGLYNLNSSEVSISEEITNISINGGNVAAVYEYTIKCNSDKSITVNFGYPDNGVYKFAVHDGSKFLSYKTRNTSYVKNTYKAENLQVPGDLWYLFNMAFAPDQTRTIRVTIEAKMSKDNNDIYPLSFFHDRNYPYAISGKNVRFELELADFRPYNIIELVGINQEEISDKGIIGLSYDNGYGRGISIKYQPIDKMILDKLSASVYKKPKAIVRNFNNGNYNETLTLCNEYINAPSDSNLSIEQVKYIEAECFRLLGNNEEYLNALDRLDITKLYPSRIRYKILIDKIEACNTIGDNEGIDMVLKQLIPEIQQGYPYLYSWLNQNGYKLKEAEQGQPGVIPRTDNPVKTSKGFDILGALIAFLTTMRESRWTYIVLSFLAGFLIGRATKRKKRRRSVYLFRD
ncbi:MAG TPA: hypothetical protein PLL98_10535 [Bacillota bacterium]|mgnify:CR=1 FL=1|nr:hypothetical protein [Bacillota bacterium]HOR86906.1 hypothetical protein [Bacillota bacterium]HPL54593.1 hypothetical protein [Bacillota bacterium]